MKNLIKYIYNSPHSNRVKINFDDLFGDEDTVLKLVNKLVQHGLVSKVDDNYSYITVKAEHLLSVVANNFEYDLEKYLDSIKPVPTKSMVFNASVTASQVGQESSFGDLEFHHKEKQYPNKPHSDKTHNGTSTISNIFKKIYNITNHQVIGGVIGGILLLLIGYYINSK
jgi:hypothetical protein